MYLVIGATGMLGQSLMKEADRAAIKCIGAARKNSDIILDVMNEESIAKAFKKINPEVVINTAAVTSIQNCDNDVRLAWMVNTRAVQLLTEACFKTNCKLVQISTDQYYCGDGDKKHQESVKISLVNEYARSKYAGEIIAASYHDSLIIRTNITGFRGWKNQPTFIEWLFGMAESGESLMAFDDYYTSTIDVHNFSIALYEMINLNVVGTYNLASSEVSSKKQFIEKLYHKMNLTLDSVQPSSIKELKPRRADSVGLDVTRAEKLLKRKLPNLNEVIDSLLMEYKTCFTKVQ